MEGCREKGGVKGKRELKSRKGFAQNLSKENGGLKDKGRMT